MLHVRIAIFCILAWSAACRRMDVDEVVSALEPVATSQEIDTLETLASGWLGQLPESVDARLRMKSAMKKNSPLAFKYVDRFLLKDLRKKSDVQDSLLTRDDQHDIEEFLRQYCAWASSSDWKLVHEFEVQPTADVVVAGGLYGHFASLRAVFHIWLERLQKDVHARLVFLGNFVDYGSLSVETAVAILALQMLMGRNVIVLRGSHEHSKRFVSSSREWTFYTNLRIKFGDFPNLDDTWDLFVQAFWKLPAAAVMSRGSQKYLMVNGGWTAHALKTWKKFSDIPTTQLSRPAFDRYHLQLQHGELRRESDAEYFAFELAWSMAVYADGKYDLRKGRRGEKYYAYGLNAISDMLDTLKVDWCVSGGSWKHKNDLWRARPLGFIKGHVQVSSANSFLTIDEETKAGAVVVIEEQKEGNNTVRYRQGDMEMTITCCCRTLAKSEACNYNISPIGLCCKFIEGSTCEKAGFVGGHHKFQTSSSSSSHCGTAPQQYWLDTYNGEGNFIAKHTDDSEFTEGHILSEEGSL